MEGHGGRHIPLVETHLKEGIMEGQSNPIYYEEVALIFIDWFYDHNFKHLTYRQQRHQLEDCKIIAPLGVCNKTLRVATHQNCELYEIFIFGSWYDEMV